MRVTAPAKSNKRLLPATFMLLRITGAAVVGYALSAAVVALMVLLLIRAGLVRSEAVVLSSMLGFLFYLGVLIWAFSVRNLARLWAVLAVGTACCALAASQFSRL